MKKAIFAVVLLLVTGTASAQLENPRRDYIGISQGLDIFNLIRGGKKLEDGSQRNPKAVDYRGRAYIGLDWWEFGAHVEIFPDIDYYAIGIDFNTPAVLARNVRLPWFKKKKLDLGNLVVIPGAEMQIVNRDDLGPEKTPSRTTLTKYYNWGLNLRLRFENIGGSRFGFEVQGLLPWRSDIIKIWGRDALPSGTLPALWKSRSLYVSVTYNFKQ